MHGHPKLNEFSSITIQLRVLAARPYPVMQMELIERSFSRKEIRFFFHAYIGLIPAFHTA